MTSTLRHRTPTFKRLKPVGSGISERASELYKRPFGKEEYRILKTKAFNLLYTLFLGSPNTSNSWSGLHGIRRLILRRISFTFPGIGSFIYITNKKRVRKRKKRRRRKRRVIRVETT